MLNYTNSAQCKAKYGLGEKCSLLNGRDWRATIPDNYQKSNFKVSNFKTAGRTNNSKS